MTEHRPIEDIEADIFRLEVKTRLHMDDMDRLRQLRGELFSAYRASERPAA